jgi:hypothetical protein
LVDNQLLKLSQNIQGQQNIPKQEDLPEVSGKPLNLYKRKKETSKARHPRGSQALREEVAELQSMALPL